MSNVNTPFINGQRHSWASVRINMLGRTITGVASINYDDTWNKENQYGAGSMVSHRGIGNYEAVANIELFQFEVVGIQTASGGKRLQQIAPFDITVVYLKEGSDELVTDVIRNCEFTKNARSLTQGDMMSKVPLELIISDIKWHGQTVK
jgi:hypothetical protein